MRLAISPSSTQRRFDLQRSVAHRSFDARSIVIGTSALGASLRGLTVARDARNPGAWLVLAGGAKETLSAWRLENVTEDPVASSADAGAPIARALCALQLRSRWLATRPPALGMRPLRNAGFNAACGERRTLALCACRMPSAAGVADGKPDGDSGNPNLIFAEASSGAQLSLRAFDAQAAEWRPVCRLVQHARPVLSLASALVGAAAGSTRCLLVSGTTDGELAVWDVSAAAAAAAADEPSSADREVRAEVRAVLVQPRRHQSGVNALAALPCAGGLLVVSGGDDQALHASLLAAEPAAPYRLTERAAVAVPCAHASAVTGLALCAWPGASAAALACSVGLDQVLRVWRLDAAEMDRAEGGAPASGRQGVQELLGERLDISEPACVAMSTLAAGSAATSGWRARLAVGGRGVHVLEVSIHDGNTVFVCKEGTPTGPYRPCDLSPALMKPAMRQC